MVSLLAIGLFVAGTPPPAAGATEDAGWRRSSRERLGVTVNIGSPPSPGSEDARRLFAAADCALYRAKAQGSEVSRALQ